MPGGRALILMYHRVAREATDPWMLCVDPDRFSDQLDVLQGLTDVVPLAHLADGHGTSRRTRVAITFDDGYVATSMPPGPVSMSGPCGDGLRGDRYVGQARVSGG